MRVSFLLLLLASPALAGCLAGGDGEEERLAKPVTQPVVVPTRVAPPSTGPSVNLSDPGYRMTGEWRVGDGWDYESNASRAYRVRVVDQRAVNGTTQYLIEERLGRGSGPLATNRSWVDARSWIRLNLTEASGAAERYQPGQPLRQLRNASVTYNVSRTDPAGAALPNRTVTFSTRLLPTHQTLLFPWGYVEARVVEQVSVTREGSGVRTQANSTRWVHADYLHDVQFQLASGEAFKLTAVRAGDFRRGTLAP